MGRKFGPDGFRKVRQRFLNDLAATLDPVEAHLTTVVFDANDAPGHVPASTRHKGITVLFAVDHDSADERIEDLIAHHSSPKTLTVVSSDHRIQKAATRRKARVLSADEFLTRMDARRNGSGPGDRARGAGPARGPHRPGGRLLARGVPRAGRVGGGPRGLPGRPVVPDRRGARPDRARGRGRVPPPMSPASGSRPSLGPGTPAPGLVEPARRSTACPAAQVPLRTPRQGPKPHESPRIPGEGSAQGRRGRRPRRDRRRRRPTRRPRPTTSSAAA